MNHIFSANLRRLRLSKGYTQEQVAAQLGVSPQSVSRWECSSTLPDVLLLPQIARLYHVTVDDLYREDAKGYPSYAQRLLAVYEASGRTEDFLAAEQEFLRISAGEHTADDHGASGAEAVGQNAVGQLHDHIGVKVHGREQRVRGGRQAKGLGKLVIDDGGGAPVELHQHAHDGRALHEAAESSTTGHFARGVE